MEAFSKFNDAEDQTVRLRAFLKWLAIAVFATALLSFVLALVNTEIRSLWASASLMCYGAGIVVAYMRLRQHNISRAATMICLGLIVLAIVNTAIRPIFFPIFLTLPTMALALALPYLNAASLLRMSVIAVLSALIIIAAGLFLPVSTLLDPLAVQLVMLGVGTSGVALVALLVWQFHSRLTETLSRTNRMNVALSNAQLALEFQVADRTAELQFTLAELEHRNDHQANLLAELEQQREVIREMSVPVLPVSATTLVMPLVGALDTQRLQDVQAQALGAIARSHARRMLLDITGVPVVDSQVAQSLLQVVQAARLLGAEVLLIGMRPEVAQALVSLGADLPGLRTCSDLQTALLHERGAAYR